MEKSRKGLIPLVLVITLLSLQITFSEANHDSKNAIPKSTSENSFWSRFYDVKFTPKSVVTPASCPILLAEYDYNANTVLTNLETSLIFTQDKLLKKYNTSITVKMVKDAYDSCNDIVSSLDPINKLMDTGRKYLSYASEKSIPLIVAHFHKYLGLETFFKFDVLPNFRGLDEENPYLIYLSPNPEMVGIGGKNFKTTSVYFLNKKEDANSMMNFMLELKKIISNSHSGNSSNWKIVELEDLDSELYGFDFELYFQELFENISKVDLDSIQFVITDPNYVKNLMELISRTDIEIIKSFILTFLKESFVVELPDCKRTIEKYVPHAATLLYTSTLSENEVRFYRDDFLEQFDLLVQEIEEIIFKYLDNEEQKKIVREKLENIGVTTEQPIWVRSEDLLEFEKEHEELEIQKGVSGVSTILSLRDFAFHKSVSLLTSKKALRSSAFRNVAMSETKIRYSRIGNWISAPMAAFMDKDDEEMTIQLAQEIVKAVDSEGFKWSSSGFVISTNAYNSQKLIPKAILGQEQCFRAHGLKEEDFSLVIGLEAAYKVLVNEAKSRERKMKLPFDLAQKFVRNDVKQWMGSDIGPFPRMTIAAGFLERVKATDQCPGDQYLPCFLPSKK